MRTSRPLMLAVALTFLTGYSSASSVVVEITPDKRPAWFQLTVAPAPRQDVRFHVAITKDPDGWFKAHDSAYVLRNSIQLYKRNQDARGTDVFEPYPGAPKVEEKREGDSVIGEFTIPRRLLQAPDLVLAFTIVLSPHPAQNVYYARLKDFAGDAAGTSSWLDAPGDGFRVYVLVAVVAGVIVLALYRRRTSS